MERTSRAFSGGILPTSLPTCLGELLGFLTITKPVTFYHGDVEDLTHHLEIGMAKKAFKSPQDNSQPYSFFNMK